MFHTFIVNYQVPVSLEGQEQGSVRRSVGGGLLEEGFPSWSCKLTARRVGKRIPGRGLA